MLSPTSSLLTGQRLDFHQLADYHANHTAPIPTKQRTYAFWGLPALAFALHGWQRMPRANRYFLPGHVWHITHRCHKKEFLFKFAKDRQRWYYWLFEAKKRYDLSVLNFIITK